MARTYIQTDDIKDGDITAPKMALNSVTTTSLTDSAVTNPKLSPLSVSQLNIQSGAVGTTQIEPYAITADLIAPGAIDSAAISPGSVTDVALAPSAKQAVLQYKKVTGYVQVNETGVVQGMTNLDVSTIIGTTMTPAYSGGISEGVIVDDPKNYVFMRNSYTDEPALTNAMEIYGRLSVAYSGITTWTVTFYAQPVGGSEVVTTLPTGLTMIDWQYLQRFNLNTVDESWAADDKFFNGAVDLTEILNINQLSKDVYTTPALTNLGNAILAKPLETQIQDIVTGLTTIDPDLAARSVPGLAIQIDAITQLHMSSGSVGLTQIEDQSILTAAIRDLNVSTGKLANDAVTNDKLANLSVSNGKLQDSAVSQVKIASAAVGLTQLENQAVDNTKLRDGAVTQAKVSAGAIGLTQLENQAVDETKLADLAVTQAKIANEAVGTTQIELLSIVNNLIRDYAVTGPKIAPNSITTDKIADGTVIAVDIAPGAVDTLELSNSAVTNIKLAVNAVTETNISDSAVTQSKIIAGAVGTTQIEWPMLAGGFIDMNGNQVKLGNSGNAYIQHDNGNGWIKLTHQDLNRFYFYDDASGVETGGSGDYVIYADWDNTSSPSIRMTAATQQIGFLAEKVALQAGAALRLYNSGDTFFAGLKASELATTDVTYELPVSDGAAGQVLATDGAAGLTWISAEILDGSITNVKLAANSVTSVNISDSSVTNSKIANQAVGLTQIELQSIVESLIRDYAVTNIKLAPNSVTTDKIAPDTVIAVDIADGAVDTPELSNSAVTNSKLAVNAVTSTNISDSAVTQSKIFAGAVGTTQIEWPMLAGGFIDMAGNTIKLGNSGNSFLKYDSGEDAVIITENNLSPVYIYDDAQGADFGTSGNRLALFPGWGLPGDTHIALVKDTNQINLIAEKVELQTGAALRFYNSTDTFFTGLKASELATTDVTYELPVNDGTSGQVLATNGAAGLTWISVEILDGSITNAKLAPNAVTTVNISDASVTNPKLAVNAVTSTNISDSAVTQTKIQAGAVGLTQIENQSITSAAIRDQAVIQTKIANGAVGLTQLEASVFASVHHHFNNLAPVSAPDGITTIFSFTVAGTPTSSMEMVFVDGVLRFPGIANDYVASFLPNQLVVNFTFVPTVTSRITASGMY